MTGNLKLLCNFVEKYLGIIRFGNDQFARILIYGDLVQGNFMINGVYYVKGLNQNLFSVGQLCDADLEVAFWKSTCFVRDLQGNDLLTDNHGSDLYTISLQETSSSTPICFMAKVLRRLGSIFTLVYVAVQKLKKALGWRFRKRLLYVKRNKAISLGMLLLKLQRSTFAFPQRTVPAGQRKPENQWTGNERKAANLDQRLKSLIMSVLSDDQMNSVINCLTDKSTWDDLILYHEGPSDVKETLMNELVNDDIKLSKLEINIGFINGLPKKWLSFCQSLRNTNNVKDSELASLFGKLKYEENLIDNIYETEKNKSLISATPLSTAFFSSSIVQDFQDSPDDEEDTRSSHEYLNDLEEEYQARALLAKSKRFFKKGTQRFSSAKATDQTECHKCGKKGHFARDYWLKTSDKQEVSSDDNEMVEVKVLMALAEENYVVNKEGAINGEWVKISKRKLPKAEGFILPNHDTGRILPFESQRNTIDPSVAVTDSSATDYDSADESLVCSTPLPPLKKLDGVEPIFVPKTIKLILRSKSIFKAEALKSVIINEPSSAPSKGNKSSLALKVHSAPAGKLKNVKIEDDHPLAIDEEEVSSNDNEMVEVKVLVALAEENNAVGKESPRNGEWVKISMRKCDIKKPIWYLDNGCSRHMTGVKSYMHKHVEQPGPKVVFGDDSTCKTEVRDVYVLAMTSSAQESCFFAKAFENLNWL
ncbi:retrovirus-related pol polyprotein from transposon TNT 1-94 [Tanacetum coccineum]